MSGLDRTTRDGAVVECLAEINEFVASLDGYPPMAVAVALAVHLHTMLSALVECDLCTAEEIHAFLQELGRDVFAEISGREGGA